MALESLEFRKKSLTSKREVMQVEAKVLHLLERYLMVEEFLGLPSLDWDKPREAPYPVINDPSEADRAAHSLRLHWDLGLDPIPKSSRTAGGARHQGALLCSWSSPSPARATQYRRSYGDECAAPARTPCPS